MSSAKGIRVGLAIFGSAILSYGIILLIFGITFTTDNSDYYYEDTFYNSYLFVIIGVLSLISGVTTICFVGKPNTGTYGLMTTYSFIHLVVGFIQILVFSVLSQNFYWYLLFGIFAQFVAILMVCKYPRHLLPSLIQQPNIQYHQQQLFYPNQAPGYPGYPQV